MKAKSAAGYPIEFLVACVRLNVRVADEHFRLWLDGQQCEHRRIETALVSSMKGDVRRVFVAIEDTKVTL